MLSNQAISNSLGHPEYKRKIVFMPRKYLGGTRTNRAFTLIELLVVIAIIAILAAILFPVFAQAKAAAKKTVALSNVKSINLGEIMYMGDYDDVFVPYFSGYDTQNYTYNPPSQYWPSLLSPYIQKAIGVGNNNQPLSGNLSKIFFDPMETFKSQAGDPNCAYGTVASWGISDDVVSWWAPDATPANYAPYSQSNVNNVAGALIFVETYDWLCAENYPGSTLALSYFDNNPNFKNGDGYVPNGATQTLQAPYQASYIKTSTAMEPDPAGKNNVGFIDGHVKSVTVGLLTHEGDMWSIGGNDQWP